MKREKQRGTPSSATAFVTANANVRVAIVDDALHKCDNLGHVLGHPREHVRRADLELGSGVREEE